MTVTVETLEKLERRITLNLSAQEIGQEVDNRLKRLSRTVKADGFRPGKVPMSVVAQRYGYSVQYEVVNDKVGKAFSDAAAEAKLRVAGTPRIAQKDEAPEGHLAFDATFEVYPEVHLGDLSALEVDRIATEVTEAAVDRTIDILRKQRRTFAQRPASEGAAETDRVTIDFEGKIDGEPFAGGKAEAFQFIIGEGQMLEQFDLAVRGMRVGESKTFPLQFPADYQGQDGTVEALRSDVRKNLEREVKFRLMSRNKAAVMDALVKSAELDVPKSLVDSETERMVESARADLKQRGIKDADTAPIPADIFKPQAERRVRLGLVVAELVRSSGLQARPDQLQKHIEELSQSYERPAEVVRYYLSDRQRMAEVEAVVIENNVTDHVLGQVKVVDKVIPFDELMASA
jgi:trigger factor